ncbi:MAG: 2-oxo-4-hydroxy-4-carboxy-5-ureidoimidazoline decarboxylase [Chthoniobacterales bacterium]
MNTVAELNGMSERGFTVALDGIWEHSPWVVERAEGGRPFANRASLVAGMEAVVDAATERERLKLICAHPDLAGKLASAGRLTAESTGEQASAGLSALTDAEREAFTERNEAYRERFGFPFVICAREHSKAGILAEFARRLDQDGEAEAATAITEIKKIARMRVEDRIRD